MAVFPSSSSYPSDASYPSSGYFRYLGFTGGSAGGGAGSGSLVRGRVRLAGTGVQGGASAGAGSGAITVGHASVISLVGGGAAGGSGSGARSLLLHPRSGGGAARGASGPGGRSLFSFTGGCGAGLAGSGLLHVDGIPLAPIDPIAPLLFKVDKVVAGGHFTGRVPVVDGVEYVLTSLSGWFGSPKTRTSRTDRNGAPGSYRRAAFKDTRSVAATITFTSVDKDPRVARLAERSIAATCSNPYQLYRLVVDDLLGTTCAYVELDGDVEIGFREGLSWSSVASMPFVAPDPRRFGLGWSTASSGPLKPEVGGVVAASPGVLAISPGIDAGIAARLASVTVRGVGTAYRLPLVFEIGGPVEDVSVLDSDSASVLSYGGLLDGPVWINCDDQPAHDVPGAPDIIPAHGAILSNGNSARSAITRYGSWPTLGPGGVITFSLDGELGSGAYFRVHTREAYI